jgi:superfamily II DNA or RNA helicase
MNDLAADPSYQQSIAMIAQAYAHKGHKVLVLANRTALLEMANVLTQRSVLITGATKDRKEQIQKILEDKADIIYGSINIFAEGISINILSCLVLAMPMNNDPLLEQLIGRITRTMQGKIQPVIVDPRLGGNTVFKQGQLRDGYYLNSGYQIIDV